MRAGESGRRPPAISRFLLIVLLRHSGVSGESILGDMEEEYLDLAEQGIARARWWYRRQALRIAGMCLIGRIGRPIPEEHTAWRGGPRRGAPLGFLGQDLRFAIRSLRRRPLFSLVAILTLSVGIGASTAMFSVVDGVLLRDLSYRNPQEVVGIWQVMPNLRGLEGPEGEEWDHYRFTYPLYRALRDEVTRFAGLACYTAGEEATLTDAGPPSRIGVGLASASLSGVLGVEPRLGRWFLESEEGEVFGQGAPVAVLSYELWSGRFAGDPEILGKDVFIEGNPLTVIGVLPPGFRLSWISRSRTGRNEAWRTDLWMPVGIGAVEGLSEGNYAWEVIGRLRAGVTLASAARDVERALGDAPRFGLGARVIPRADDEVAGVSSPILFLFSATGLLLLIACGNVASLFMGELNARVGELTTRSALGAGASRIRGQLLTECILVGLLGSLSGTGVAVFGTRFLVAYSPSIPGMDAVGVDLRALAFSTGAGVLVGVLFGSVPALAMVGNKGRNLLSRGRTTASKLARRFERGVVSGEIALTVVLLVGGGLLTRSFARLMAEDPGFEVRDLATVGVSISRINQAYQGTEDRLAFIQEVLQKLDEIPVAGPASVANNLPFPGQTGGWSLSLDGETRLGLPFGYQVGPKYFETLGIPLIEGRLLSASDGPDGPPVAVVSRTMAERYWPGRSPVGEQFQRAGGPWVRVVGVVGDVKRRALDGASEPVFYQTVSQLVPRDIRFVLRIPEAEAGITLLRDAVWSVDPDLAIIQASTMSSLVAQSADDERYRTGLMGIFTGVATLLALVGVFGAAARNVSSRTRELGVRKALGATDGGLIGDVVSEGLKTAGFGLAVGMAAALEMGGLLEAFLFGVKPLDLPTYAGVACVVILACVAGTFLPARRISSMNVVRALRPE